MLTNVALQVAVVGCYTTTRSQQLAIFLAGFSYPELLGTKSVRMRPCQYCEKSCRKGDTLCNGVANCCNPLQKSRAEFYFVQRFAQQQKNYGIIHVTQCNSLTTLRHEVTEELHCVTLLRKLRSVTGPLHTRCCKVQCSLCRLQRLSGFSKPLSPLTSRVREALPAFQPTI